MKARTLHRVIGVVLVLPMLGWAATGFVFFVKPGYGGAYESLPVKTYPLESGSLIGGDPGRIEPGSWLEYRGVRTILGDHLLVRTASGWSQLHPTTLQPLAAPSEDQVRRLVTDAFSVNPSRYGTIARADGDSVTTDTGIEISVDWSRLSLQQQGRDTAFIDRLYKVHYLQWTGVRSIDRILGMAGLVLVLASTILGVRLAFGRR